MNRKGFTALMDAVFVIAILTVASTVIVQTTSGGDEPDVQKPTVFLDAVFDGKIRYTDLNVDVGSNKIAQMPDVAYVSISLGDGMFERYIEALLKEVYPWEGSYHLTMASEDATVELGAQEPDMWMSSERTYQTSFGYTLSVGLSVYR